MDNTYIQNQIDKISRDLADLNSEVYRNNFSASQDFNKASSFTVKLKVPHYSTLPVIGEVGEIIEVSGKLYICSMPNSWSLVGLQS